MEKYMNENLSFRERAKDLVSKMTAEEKCSQMKYDAPAIERLGIQEYNWWNEGLHGAARSGTATVFPQAIALAAMFSPEWIKKAAEVIAVEQRAKYNAASSHNDFGIYKGLTLWSPNVNIYRDPRWGRGQETYGEDPYLTSILGIAFVKGIQKPSGKYITAAACLKHFAAHSGPEAIRHGFNAEVSPKDLEETYLPHFRRIIEETDVSGVMGAYNALNGEPTCANRYLTDILRNKWGFKGYFVSDCWAVKDFHEKFKITDTPAESAALAVRSQCDLNCGCTYQHLLTAYSLGKVTDKDLTRSTERLMEVRLRLGMSDVTELDDIPFDVIDCQHHKDINLECARRSVVLLKNNGLLPLDRNSIETIAVIGPNADRKEALEGNYCGTSSEYITFLRGIQEKFGKRVIYAQGCHLFEERTESIAEPGDRLSEAVSAAETADVVIMCLGLDASIEGEEGDTGNAYASGDRMNLRYPQPQRDLLRCILAVGKPTIIITASGGAMNPETELDDARLQCWYPGAQGGRAAAEIIFGDVSPSGKLPVTFYKTADDLPDFIDYSMNRRTYRYAGGNILYPFGHGLTYGNVVCSSVRWEKAEYGGIIHVRAVNKGMMDTEDVLQAYIKIKSHDAVKNHSLCGVKRIFLKKGESKAAAIPIDLESFTVVREDGKRYIDADSQFRIYVDTKQPAEESLYVDINLCDIGKGE